MDDRELKTWALVFMVAIAIFFPVFVKSPDRIIMLFIGLGIAIAAGVLECVLVSPFMIVSTPIFYILVLISVYKKSQN
jgi:hypothetical protein